MAYYIIKVLITVVLIVAIAEISKKSTFFAAILASIPLVSVLAMFWLYVDTKDVTKVSALATSVFWLVIPSLMLFISLPLLLKQGLNFYLSMLLSIIITIACYFILLKILSYSGIKV